MEIDWFTVSAQALNFLLLVWLLKRYLYGPLLKAIDARESQVAKVLRDADTIKYDAELKRKLFAQKNIEIETKRDELLKEAKITAGYQSEQIILKAHKKADEISISRLIALEKGLQHYQDNITLNTLQEIYEVARKVLADLADVELEQKMLECFCKHLQNISPDEKTNLDKIVGSGSTGLLLCSAFELTTAQLEKINLILQDVISPNINRHSPLKYEVKPELISGIELRSNAWKIAWNSEDYLKTLQSHITQLLDKQREIIHSQTMRLNASSDSAKDSI